MKHSVLFFTFFFYKKSMTHKFNVHFDLTKNISKIFTSLIVCLFFFICEFFKLAKEN